MHPLRHNLLVRLFCEEITLGKLKLALRRRGMIALVATVSVGFGLLEAQALKAADAATVTFSLDFPTSDPEHYSISVESGGRVKYECSAKISEESEEREKYETAFTLSDATRARIFDLAGRAHYFSGKIDSGNKKLAFTGVKKLTYKDGQHDTAADYNYSQQPAVQQLTNLFQGMAATLEFGRRIAHYRRYQKLALDEELKRMENEAQGGSLAEISAAQGVLQEVYDDASVINVVRARAQRIIELGKAQGEKR